MFVYFDNSATTKTLKKVNEEYASRVQVINSTPEETKRRVKR